MHINMVTYCNKGYDRYDKELTEEQINEIIDSHLSIFIVVHSKKFDVLVVDDKYLLNKTDIQSALNLQLPQLQKDKQISHLGLINDQPLCLVKVNVDSDKFVRFYDLKYAEFDCLSQITGVCYSLTKYHWYQQYCSQCREELVFENRNNVYKRCLECQQTYYPQLQPATICLITYEDKALLCHRRQNIYTTLSGFMEPLETSEQTLLRELNEEIGLPADQIDQIRFQDFDQPWPSRYCALMLPYVVRLKSYFTPTLTDEIKDYKWVDKVEFMEAAGRSDQGLLGDGLEWIAPNRQTIARYMMELFFSGHKYFD